VATSFFRCLAAHHFSF